MVPIVTVLTIVVIAITIIGSNILMILYLKDLSVDGRITTKFILLTQGIQLCLGQTSSAYDLVADFSDHDNLTSGYTKG
jgi:hypothetical protein